MRDVAIVAIGRNEGERLRRCLESVRHSGSVVVYVDSGSTDRSVELARSMGAEVVELDPSVPFTMGRGRNAGFQRLLQLAPHVEFVQFVDGDCEVVESWLARGREALKQHPDAVVVSGRRRERHRNASIFHRLIDMEWDTPIGQIQFFHGDAMIRAEAFRNVGGFNPTMIAGEEPELAVRLRQLGGKIIRVNAEMTLHDAEMTRFSQWWKRAMRAGHAYAEGAWLHGLGTHRHHVRNVSSILFWAMALPFISFGMIWPTQGVSLLFFIGYPILWWRIFRDQRRRGHATIQSRLYATFTVLGKFPELFGALRFVWTRLRGRQTTIIEYKGVTKSRDQQDLAHCR